MPKPNFTDALVRILEKNPRIKLLDLAKLLRRPPSTVRKALARLVQQGIVQKGFTVHNLAPEFSLRAFIAIDFELQALESKKFGYSNQRSFLKFLRSGLLESNDYCRFASKIRVETAEVLLGGREDAFAIVSCRDHTTLVEFVTECLRYLPGVGRTNTAMLEQLNVPSNLKTSVKGIP